MDIDWYMTMAAAKDNAPTKNYMQQSGMRLSAYEHLIPETLFTDQNDPNRPQGVSAVKALAIASAQGQKIYTITGQNIATALPALTIGSEIKEEIRNAVNAGQTVTVSQGNITVSGWTGVGYIISDPATGAGAYKISGGANGNFIPILIWAIVTAFIIIELAAFIAAGGWAIGIILLGLEMFTYFDFLIKLQKVNNETQYNQLVVHTVISGLVGAYPCIRIGWEAC